MERAKRYFARLLAALALGAVVVAVIVIVGNADLGSDSPKSRGDRAAHTEKQRRPRTKAKKYVVQSGDNLTSIAHQTGVSLRELEALNPGVDPLTLGAGEVLKLR